MRIYLYDMKILLTEKQVKLIEQEDKIEQYIHDLGEYNIKFKKYYDQNYNVIVSLTILDCMIDIERMRSKLRSMEETKNMVNKKYDFYYGIIEGYSWLNQPENISRLEKQVDYLSDCVDMFSDLINALDGIIDSAKYLKKNYDKIQ